jgi:hypothetical protein
MPSAARSRCCRDRYPATSCRACSTAIPRGLTIYFRPRSAVRRALCDHKRSRDKIETWRLIMSHHTGHALAEYNRRLKCLPPSLSSEPTQSLMGVMSDVWLRWVRKSPLGCGTPTVECAQKSRRIIVAGWLWSHLRGTPVRRSRMPYAWSWGRTSWLRPQIIYTHLMSVFRKTRGTCDLPRGSLPSRPSGKCGIRGRMPVCATPRRGVRCCRGSWCKSSSGTRSRARHG